MFDELNTPDGDTGLTALMTEFDKSERPDLSDCLVQRPKPWWIVIWEPLQTKAPAPPKTQPFCCYINTVIFYHSPYIVSQFGGYWRDREGMMRMPEVRGFVEWDHVETRMRWNMPVQFENDQFEVGGGSVMWARRPINGEAGKARWWMRQTAKRKRGR